MLAGPAVTVLTAEAVVQRPNHFDRTALAEHVVRRRLRHFEAVVQSVSLSKERTRNAPRNLGVFHCEDKRVTKPDLNRCGRLGLSFAGAPPTRRNPGTELKVAVQLMQDLQR